MTPRELRTLLFAITDQSLTISDLRAALFTVQDQDTELTTEALKAALTCLLTAKER